MIVESEIQIRILGRESSAVVSVVKQLEAMFPGCGVLGPYLNLREPGVRMYVVLKLREDRT
jgi:hypothetical protein